MATYSNSFTSPRSPSDVFEYLARFSNAAEWDPGVVGAQDMDGGPPRLGSTYRLVVRFFGRQVPLDYKIVAIDPPRRVVFKAENTMLKSTDTIEVASAPGGGAQVTYVAVLSLRGAFTVMSPVLGLAFKRVGDRAIAGLRSRLAV